MTSVSEDYLSYFVGNFDSEDKKSVCHLGQDMGAFSAQYDPNWKIAQKLPGERWIIYVGTVSQNYDLETVVRALDLLPSDVRLIMIGDGPDLSRLKTMIDTRRCTITGKLPYRDMVNYLYRADVGVIPVRAASHIRFPGKVFDYLAAGLSVASNIRSGELESLIGRSALGVTYSEGSPVECAAALDTCLRRPRLAASAAAKEAATRLLDAKVEGRRFAEWIEQEILPH